MTMQGGRDMGFRTCDTGGTNTPILRMRINHGGNVDFFRIAVFSQSTTDHPSLRIPHGSAPTSPTNGDLWTTTSGMFVRINGVTKTVTLT